MSSSSVLSSYNQRFGHDGFLNVTKDFPFLQKIEDIIGKPTIDRIFEKKDLQAEVFFLKKEIVWIIVYKTELQSRFSQEKKDNFEIKKIVLTSSNASLEQRYEDLLDRVITLAKKKFAKGILITIHDSSSLLKFLLEKNFSIVKTWKETKTNPKEHLIQYILPSSNIVYFSKKDNNRSSKSEEKITSCGKRKEREEKPEIFIPNKSRHTASKIHNLPIKGTIYLEYIMNGKKQFEGRVCGPACQAMQVGDRLKLFNAKARWGIICEIVSKDWYNTFKEMLEDKGVLPLLPQLEEQSKCLSKDQLLQEGLKIYQSFPGSFRVNQHGAVAIGVKFIKRIFN